MPTSGFTFGNLGSTDSIFYNDPSNRGVGWQMLKDYLNTGVGNPRYNSYLDSRMSDEYNRYLKTVNDTKGAYKWTDHLQNIQNSLSQGWQDLSTSARGGNPGLYGANQRFLG
jgi:hypothetical protein